MRDEPAGAQVSDGQASCVSIVTRRQFLDKAIPHRHTTDMSPEDEQDEREVLAWWARAFPGLVVPSPQIETPRCPCCTRPAPGLTPGTICALCAGYPLD